MNMLARKILDLKEFQDEFSKVLLMSAQDTLPERLSSRPAINTEIDWAYMLFCASLLSQADDGEAQDAALRIAQHCISSDTDLERKIAATVILGKLTNSPAIKLALDKDLIPQNYDAYIPPVLRIEKAWRDYTHTIEVAKQPKSLNKFQKKLYLATQEGVSVSASAPTSAGKSFVLSLIVAKTLSESNSPQKIVFIVPTRALISEVEKRFEKELGEYGILDSVYLSSVPKLPSQLDLARHHLFIFTQERLHWFLTDNPDYKVDILVVDEAQKISDTDRGILLQEKIEQVQNINPECRVLFCSAFSENPELLLGITKESGGIPLTTDYVAVNQNLIYLSQVPRKPKLWDASLCLKNKSISLARVEFEDALSTQLLKWSTLPVVFGAQTGNLVYTDIPSNAENIAVGIVDGLKRQGLKEDEETFKELIDLSKRLIHPEYLLQEVLPYGVAFHYGNMPTLIREEIEKHFKLGNIKYLVCTSTLLEGVNLSAKSIFITKPSRGPSKPMSETDFWNLAGRAGRLTKDFQGNIYCFEPQKWEYQPTPAKRRYEIKQSLSEVTKNEDGFLDFILAHLRDSGKRDADLERALSYYFLKYLNDEDEAINLSGLEDILTIVDIDINLPKEILARNPGISPVAMQRLYDHFENHENPAELLPPKSLRDEDAVGKYTAIVNRVNEHLAVPSERRSLSPFREALLAVQWMRGFPLPFIIKSYYEWQQDKKLNPKLSNVIRETMKNIETDIRFGFAKFVTCYLDILSYFYQHTNRKDLVAQIPDIRTWVEFGVSETTQVSFINLGLSRHVAIELSKMVGSVSLDEEGSIQWLKKLDLAKSELPETYKAEIRKLKSEL